MGNLRQKYTDELTKEPKSFAEKWANSILSDKNLKKKFEDDFKDFFLYGKTPLYADSEFLKDLKDYVTEEYDLSTEDIIKRFQVDNPFPIEDIKLNQFIMIEEDMQIIVNKSGYPHAPYLVTWINAYEQCGAEILTREQLKEKYKI